MSDEELCPTITPAASLEEAAVLLGESGPTLTNPAGEKVELGSGWEPTLELDPQRAALVPVALEALRRPHQIWRLSTGEGGDSIEHQPHLVWSRSHCDADGEVTLAGTRRIGDRLHLHTWFRLARPWRTLRRFWSQGTLEHPRRHLQPLYVPTRDVVYLHPEPHIPYRATRIVQQASVFGYLDARLDLPSLVGFEIQDAMRTLPLLSQAAEIAGLLASSWGFGDEAVVPLAAYLGGFACERTDGAAERRAVS